MPIESRATVSQKNKNRELRVESDSKYNRYESISVGQNNASPGKTKLNCRGQNGVRKPKSQERTQYRIAVANNNSRVYDRHVLRADGPNTV
jgi:hypothetical protein